MFSFAFKNILTKKAQLILLILSITVSATAALVSYNVAEQVADGITSNASYYSAIIGPAGSNTQLALNTMYFSDSPLGTIPYEIIYDLRRDSRVTEIIPFAMADSYNGFSVVGTTSKYLSGKALSDGDMFSDDGHFEVVVGYNVAKFCSLSIGDKIHTSHSVGSEHAQAFTVIGILGRTHTAYDNIVFTELKSIWEVHGHEEEHSGHADEDECCGENGVCAFLIKTKNPSFAMTLVNEYDGKVWMDEDGCTASLQAIEPMATIRAVLEDTNTTKYVVYALCSVILVMNIIVISIITIYISGL